MENKLKNDNENKIKLNNKLSILKDELFKTNKKLDIEIKNINILKTKQNEKNKELFNLNIKTEK